MLRISDIFKKHKEEKKKQEGLPPASQNGRENIPLTEGVQVVPPKTLPSNARISVFSAVSKEMDAINGTKAADVYEEALQVAKRIYRKDASCDSLLLSSVALLVEKGVDLLSAGNKNLMKLCLNDYANPQEYFPRHCINVCMIAIEVGLGFGYERPRLIEIGIAGFLHDIGKVKYLDSINKNGTLSEDEFAQVKKHPSDGLDILSPFAKELSHNVLDVVRQEHERLDGSGYPLGLKNHQISEYARIIGLIDVYEAMMHQRPYRGKFTSLETIKTILTNKNRFDAHAIKILIERIGIFPVGTLVKLNTKETGIVIRENPDLPLRPTVNILFDSQGKELKDAKEVNLADNSMLYVEECLKGC